MAQCGLATCVRPLTQPREDRTVKPSYKYQCFRRNSLTVLRTVSGVEHALVCQLWQHAYGCVSTWPGEHERRETCRVRNDFRRGEEENRPSNKVIKILHALLPLSKFSKRADRFFWHPCFGAQPRKDTVSMYRTKYAGTYKADGEVHTELVRYRKQASWSLKLTCRPILKV